MNENLNKLRLNEYNFENVFKEFEEEGFNEPFLILPNIERVYNYIKKEDVVKEGKNWLAVPFSIELNERLEEANLLPIIDVITCLTIDDFR